MTRLKDKIAIIAGASREGNMGQAIARRFIAEGAKVVVAGRSREPLEAFASSVGATAITCDLSRKAGVDRLAVEAVDRFGGIDIAVNAVATGSFGPFEETTEETLDEMLSIIFKGSFFFMQTMVTAMKHERRGGAIINISSAVADIMFEQHAAYMGAKAGMNHVTRTVANEFGRYGIRANIIAPGMTITPMSASTARPGVIETFAKEYPLGRINTCEDVANCAVFVASDECFMTGQTFHVTGGLTLRRNPTLEELAGAAGGFGPS